MNADLEAVIERELAQNWQYLREYQESYETNHVTVFNFPVSSCDEIPPLVERVMDEQDSVFMIQVTVGERIGGWFSRIEKQKRYAFSG